MPYCFPLQSFQAFNKTEIEFKLGNVQKIWQRFLYRDSIMLEAERQNATYGRKESWADEFSQLVEDDVFATVVQVFYLIISNSYQYFLSSARNPTL